MCHTLFAAQNANSSAAVGTNTSTHPLAKAVVVVSSVANAAADPVFNPMAGFAATTLATTAALATAPLGTVPNARAKAVPCTMATSAADPVADPMATLTANATADHVVATLADTMAMAVPDTEVKAKPPAMALGAATAAATAAAGVVAGTATALARPAAVAVGSDDDHVASSVAATTTSNSVSDPVAAVSTDAAADPATAAFAKKAALAKAVLGTRAQAVSDAVVDTGADAGSCPVADPAAAATEDTAAEVAPNTVADPTAAATDTSHLDPVVADTKAHPPANTVANVLTKAGGELVPEPAMAAPCTTSRATTTAEVTAGTAPRAAPKAVLKVWVDDEAHTLLPPSSSVSNTIIVAEDVGKTTTIAVMVPNTTSKAAPGAMADHKAASAPMGAFAGATMADPNPAVAATAKALADAAHGIHDNFLDNLILVDNETSAEELEELSGSRLQPPASRLQAPGSSLQASGSRLQAPGSRLQASGSRLQAINYFSNEITDENPTKPTHPRTINIVLDEDKTSVAESKLPPAGQPSFDPSAIVSVGGGNNLSRCQITIADVANHTGSCPLADRLDAAVVDTMSEEVVPNTLAVVGPGAMTNAISSVRIPDEAC